MRHELHLARFGFLALAGVAVAGAAAGAVLGGREGALSALVGVTIVAANHASAVASTGWARVVGPRVIAIGYAFFVVRLMLVFAAFAALQAFAWIDDVVLAASFCVALVASLAAECVSYVRGSYVPSWRVR